MAQNIDEPIASLMDILPQKGRLQWIGIRAGRKAPPVEVSEVYVSDESGLEGDHFNATSTKRQVTLIQAEHLRAVASILGRETIDPKLTRRNLVVEGINLFSLRGRQFKVGEVVLEGTGHCHPCSRMEENLGAGGYNAMRGHGGLTARVVKPGKVRLGDEICLYC